MKRNQIHREHKGVYCEEEEEEEERRDIFRRVKVNTGCKSEKSEKKKKTAK